MDGHSAPYILLAFSVHQTVAECGIRGALSYLVTAYVSLLLAEFVSQAKLDVIVDNQI